MTTVLLAEPEPVARGVGKQQLESAGFTVLTAAREEDLDRYLAQVDAQALVLDRRMAGPSGEVVRRLREQQRRTACYVLALLPSGPDRQALLEAGADWYIDKNALLTPLPSAVLAGLTQAALPATSPIRPAPRVRIGLAVEYCHAGRMASGETINISPGGMFLKTPSPLDPGSLILIKFSLPGHRPWECFAQVMWRRNPEDEHPYPAGMGIQFLELEPEARTALADFVAARLAAPSLLS